MLDIEPKWFILLVINFFVMIFLLNKILFKPILTIIKEREDTVKGSLDAAKELENRKEEGIASLNKEMADARGRAKEVFENSRNEGMDRQRQVLSEAEAAAAERLQKAREELRAEAEKARLALRADVEKFSDEIVRKLVEA